MRCVMCNRPLLVSAVPGLHVGPTCAKKRGLSQEKGIRLRKVEDEGREVDPRQVDWLNSLDSEKVGLIMP